MPWHGQGLCSSWETKTNREMKTNLAEELPTCGKMLENLKVQLATPREAMVIGIVYFKVHLGKQISSLCFIVAAAPWTLPN